MPLLTPLECSGSWWRLCGSAEVLGGLWVGCFIKLLLLPISDDYPKRRQLGECWSTSEVGVGDAQDFADGGGG